MVDGVEWIVIAARTIAAITVPTGTRNLGLRSFAPNICHQTLIKNLRERIHRYEGASTKDDFFLLGVQSNAASPDVAVRINETEQWRYVAVVGDAPHRDAAISASAGATACFTTATTASIAAAFSATATATTAASTRRILIIVAATAALG